MVDYANHQFKCFIPEKNVEDNLPILQPICKDVRSVKKLDDFLIHYGEEHTSFNQDTTMERFQEKIWNVMRPFLGCGRDWGI